MSDELRIGIDTGGTFTDVVVAEGERLISFKVPSTPGNPATAIIRGVRRALEMASEGESTSGRAEKPVLSEIVHGTTVATNALLERKGARTALITTEGFEDVIEIGRQARPELYNLLVTRTPPLVPRDLRFGAKERVLPDGSVLTALSAKETSRLARFVKKSGAESVAVCLLFSFANPAHEQEIAATLEPLGVPVSLSHLILPEYREYERTSTTVINAYLVPLMSRYLKSLVGEIESLGKEPRNARRGNQRVLLRVMQSNGGSVSAQAAGAEPVRAILSGPAGGVVGALHVTALAGVRDIITFDMGGTSTDVALCRGEARTTNEASVAGLPVAIPIIDIHTVGAGGGSIAHVDEAGALRVGPESAGADPGPVCYGRGEKVTVTDANLVLGRFGGNALLGGEMTLDAERARHFVSLLADLMSVHSRKMVSPEQAALGVVAVANANMEQALRRVSIERGQDPRLFTLVSFGGAGGLHVAELAAALRIPRILVPASPGTLSALGVLLGDVVKDYSRTVMLKTEKADARLLEREYRKLETSAYRDLNSEGFKRSRVRLDRSVAMRYTGQSFEIGVPWGASFESEFHRLHQQRYGYADASRPTEIVNVKVRASGITEKPELLRHRLRKSSRAVPAFESAIILPDGKRHKTPVYKREELPPGANVKGPCIVTEYSSTTLIPAGHTAHVDIWLNLIIEAAL